MSEQEKFIFEHQPACAFFFFFFLVPGIESRALLTLGKCFSLNIPQL
jgi:hypothetical protein